MKYFFGILFLFNEVDDYYVNDLMIVQPNNKQMQLLSEYIILDTYILPDAKFSPNICFEFAARCHSG